MAVAIGSKSDLGVTEQLHEGTQLVERAIDIASLEWCSDRAGQDEIERLLQLGRGQSLLGLGLIAASPLGVRAPDGRQWTLRGNTMR